MKKLGVILLFAIAAFVFVGCSDEGTSLRWKNKSTVAESDYEAIQWVKYGGGPNQRWDGVPSVGGFTGSKSVSALTGSGEVLEADGTTADITLDDTDAAVAGVSVNGQSSVVLSEGADATLVISEAKKK